jgi:enoyl-CoA hydratase/carnithine racemase
VEPSDVLPRVLELADDIARNTSSVSTHLIKDIIWRGADNAEEPHLLTSKILVELFKGKDKLEGVESCLQKRETNFTGTMSKDAPSAWPWWKPIETTVPGMNPEKSKR